MNGRARHPLPATKPITPRILLVEDDTMQRYVMAEWLREFGYEVVEAASADEAKVLLSSVLSIQVVITDVDMPGRMNGYYLADHVCRKSPSIPVIVASGRARQRQAGSVRSGHFVLKPYDPEAVTQLIATLLSSQRQPDEP